MRDRVLRPGRVIDAAGRPIPGAMVSVVWGTVATPEIGRRTNANGAFQIGLPPGRFRIEAIAQDGTGQVEVDGGEGDEIVIRVASP